MKKFLAIALAFALTFCSIGIAEAFGDANDTASLTVGVLSKMSGHFFTEKWDTNSVDMDLRMLIHGHETVSWEITGNVALNGNVIKSLDAVTDGASKTYRITFNENLAFSDGSPITARDYAFTALLMSSKEFSALGGTPSEMSYLVGYEDYLQGGIFSGIRVPDDQTLVLTVDEAYLPYFYEIMLLNLIPYPIDVIAPGCRVVDDGDGAYIEGPFTQELLTERILNKETGYLYHPAVSSGPYRLVSFDENAQVAMFEKNPYYTGNFEGVVPTIEKITVCYTEADTVFEKIESGALDMVNKISSGAMIIDGLGRVNADKMSSVNYLRSGMNFISFSCEMGPTASTNVRKAISLLVDAAAVNEAYTTGFGVPVYGYYGMGQWMATSTQETMVAYESSVDLNEAAALLKADGWGLNAAGEAYDEDAGGVRYRMGEDGNPEPLLIKWAQPEETALSALLEEAMRSRLESVGFDISIDRLPFNKLLDHYYRHSEREYHMFNLAKNFSLMFDPYFDFHTGDAYQGEANTTGLRDETLMNLALALRATPADDSEAYLTKWLAFQARFNELTPAIPLFSNVHFDFFRADLQEYRSNAYIGWAAAIPYVYIGDTKTAPDGEEADALFE